VNFGKLATVVGLALAAATASLGQTLGYAQSSVQVKAGVLLIRSQQVGGQLWNPAPHHWTMLDQDRSIKPASWSFINPLGQTAFTDTMRLRWLANPSAGSLPTLGQNLSKNNASYWEVTLAEATDAQLSQFDVLSLTVAGNLSLNSDEREKLRRFIDGGGVLWVDLLNEGALVIDEFNGTPYAFGGVIDNTAIQANLYHPILTFPNAMTLDEVRMTSYSGAGATVTNFTNIAGTGLTDAFATIDADSAKLEAIAGNASGRTISAARLGDGYLVVTSRGISATLGRGRLAAAGSPPQANRAFTSLSPVEDNAFYAAAKFAVNLVWLSSNSPTGLSGSRHTSSVAANVSAPLLGRFTSQPAGFTPGKTAALTNGRVVAVSGSTIAVFDSNPSADLNGDGDSDDGVSDTPSSGQDILWASDGDGGTLSSPTVIEAPETTVMGVGGPAVNQVWVTSSTGNVLVFDLASAASMTVPALRTIAPPTGGAVNDPLGPFAPTVHDGLVFIADTRIAGFGRIWICDLNSASVLNTGSAWAVQATSRMPEVSGSPTVGYIPIQDSSGGVDRVIYQATQPNAPTRPAGLTSIWVGAKGESPYQIRRAANRVRLQTRAALNGLPIYLPGGTNHLGVRVTLLKPNGLPFTPTELNTVCTGNVFLTATNGEVEVELGPGADAVPWGFGTPDYDGTLTPNNTGDDVGWRIDYTIDWSAAVAGTVAPDSYVRGNLEMPDSSANNRRILGSPALTSRGQVIVVTTPPSGPGGSVLNFREEGRGDFSLLNRYDLHDSYTFTLNGSTGVSDTVVWPDLFSDEDELLIDLPFLNAPIKNLRFVGAPSVRGELVYVMAAGAKNLGFGNADTSVVIALRANPNPAEFEVDNNLLGNPDQLSIVQTDYARNTNKVNPDINSALPRRSLTIEPIVNTNRSKIIMPSLMSVTRGTIRDSISTSQPLILRNSAGTDVLIEPEMLSNNGQIVGGASRGRFNPLVWYTVMNGYRGTQGPVVAGSTMYVGGESILPGLITGAGFIFNGLMFAMDSQISPNDTFLEPNNVRPWQNQLVWVRKKSATPFDFSIAPAMKWPQIQGIRNGPDFRIRLLQSALPDTNLYSLAVGDGTLAATSASRLFGFTRSDLTVIDEGRVVKLDPVGNPIWTLSQTFSGGVDTPITNSTTGRKLSSPTRAYPSDNGSWWIVDSGNNRVVLVDSAGREQRSVTNMKLHPQFTPPGFQTSEDMNLRLPMDAQSFTTRHTAAQVAAQFPGETVLGGATDELWRHVLIADAGNFRAIELIDRYKIDTSGRVTSVVQYADANAGGGYQTAYGVLIWHSPEELSGRRFAYNSIARTYLDDGNPATPRVQAIAFGFGNLEPGKGTVGLDSVAPDPSNATGYGGVVIYANGQTSVINDYMMPAIAANTYLGSNGGGTWAFNTPAANQPAQKRGIAGLKSVTLRAMSYGGQERLGVMITDATGVYELVQDIVDPTQWNTNWMLPKEAYVGLRRPTGGPVYTTADIGLNPSGFAPTFAQRLDNNDILIVNSFVGAYRNTVLGPFNGEVIIVNGTPGSAGPYYDPVATNLGFSDLILKFAVPPMQGVRGLVRPVFAARQ
jgi:hypothetical protein